MRIHLLWAIFLFASSETALKGKTKVVIEINVSEIPITKSYPISLALNNTSYFYERDFSKSCNEEWEIKS